MARRMRCPECGNEDLQILRETNVTTTGKNYSGGQGCLGFLMFGPLGLLCGNCGQGQQTQTTSKTYWVCRKCGHKFRDPEEWKSEAKNLRGSGYIMMVLGIVIFLMMLLFGAGGGIAFFALILFAVFGCGLLWDAECEEDKIRKLESFLNDKQ